MRNRPVADFPMRVDTCFISIGQYRPSDVLRGEGGIIVGPPDDIVVMICSFVSVLIGSWWSRFFMLDPDGITQLLVSKLPEASQRPDFCYP